MFEKTNRSGLIIYLYYNRDAKKSGYGRYLLPSKKHRYLQLYVPTEELDDLVERLGKERYIKKIRRCHIQELENSLRWESLSNRRKTLSFKKVKQIH